MAFNGSGTFLINSVGNPVVTGTTISSTWANALTADLATGLTNTICKDGQSTTTGTIPFATAVTMASTLAVTGTSTLTGKTRTIAGAYTASGQPSVANGAASTIVSASTAGLYIVYAMIYDGVAATVNADAMISSNRTNARIQRQQDGTQITITLVGLDIRVNNGTGSTATIDWTYLFIPTL